MLALVYQLINTGDYEPPFNTLQEHNQQKEAQKSVTPAYILMAPLTIVCLVTICALIKLDETLGT